MPKLHLLTRILIALMMTILSVVVITSVIALYFIATPSGGQMMVGYLIKKYGAAASFTVGYYEGSITQGFIVKDVTLKRLPRFPDAVARIQQVRIQIPWGIPTKENVSVHILNGRIFLPESDPILFNGHLVQGHVDMNIFARSIDVTQITHPFLEYEDWRRLQGFVTNVDVMVKGPVMNPKVTGHLFVDKISYQTTTVSEGFGRVDFVVTQWSDKPQIKGEAGLDVGLIHARHVDLDLQRSRIYFMEDTYNPRLDIHAGTKVEDIQIDFTLKGTFRKPQLILTSNPPMSEDILLLVLATGKSRSSTSSPPLTGGSLPTELAGDFMDYLLLGGDDFSTQYDKGDSKVGLRRRVTDDFKVGIGIQQRPTQPGQYNQPITYDQTLEGEMDMTDDLSLNVARKVTPNDERSTQTAGQRSQQTGETQIYLKYKKNF